MNLFDENTTYSGTAANEKLNQLISTLPVVYGRGDPLWSVICQDKDTHRARLICIEEIQNKECEHQPKDEILAHIDGLVYIPICKHCGVKLKAEWKAVGNE